jgi:glycosyltransferase involved in cell wall biosynthesis
MTTDMPGMSTASVIIPVYNAEATIGECIRSLLSLEYPKDRLELIVVDNASTDRTRMILEGFGNQIRILSQVKRGAAAARNTGIRQASGACIAFTDADCKVEPGWLRHLLPPLGDPAVGITGGEILSARPCNRIELFGEKLHDHQRAMKEFVTPYAITMNWASRRAVLEEVGLFDEGLLRGQDVDLAHRIRADGYRLVYCPDAKVFHRNESTFRGLLVKGFLHGRARVMTLDKAARLAHAPVRRPLATERRVLRNCRRCLTGPDRFDHFCAVVFDLGKVAGESAALIAIWRSQRREGSRREPAAGDPTG